MMAFSNGKVIHFRTLFVVYLICMMTYLTIFLPGERIIRPYGGGPYLYKMRILGHERGVLFTGDYGIKVPQAVTEAIIITGIFGIVATLNLKRKP